MVKYTQAIRGKQPTNCLSVFDHFVGLVFKGLKGYHFLAGGRKNIIFGQFLNI